MRRVLELINYSGPFKLEPETVVVSLPETSHVTANTLVRIQGRKTSGLYGDHAFRYNRTDLQDFREREITIPGAIEDVNALLAYINTTPIFSYTLGNDGEAMRKPALLLVEDIVNESLRHITAGTTTHITVKANKYSYLYLGALKVKLIRL